ncbi:hypothetical protein [Algibacter lectus]|uniref:hypothetical protein n=1 Tax=Algibacter lectus TaxID=221126 RepID=UPI0026EB0DA2|nr:hypothetical protein [Algibacter lectus]MDO7135919.1 hypothetical protein [Algibacter lectus]
MSIYIYQNWSRGYSELQSEKITIKNRINFYKSPNNDNDNITSQKSAKKFLKTCKNPEAWAKYAYNDKTLMFHVCKMSAHHVEAYMEVNRFHGKGNFVYFLDEHNRVFMDYWFEKQDNGKYFISQMMFFDYINGKTGDDDYTKSWQYNFTPDGNVAVIIRTKGESQEEVWNSKEPLNVSSNWEDSPEFGNWEGFFTMKRWEEGEIGAINTSKNQKKYIYKDGNRYYKDEDGNLIEDN